METIGIGTTLRLSGHLVVAAAFCSCCWLMARGALASATESQPSITYYLLPQGDPRCQLASSRLRCLDQSVIVATAEPPPPLSAGDAILEDLVLCGGTATTWAAVGCTQDDIGGELAWQLAFLVTAPACGDRLVFNSSLDSPLLLRHQHWQSLPGGSLNQTVTFGCRTHAYPYLHRPAYKFTQMQFWHNSSSGSGVAGKPVNVTIHVYARFHPDLPLAERATKCAWLNGFWCHQGNATCVYSTHQCNGYDDCLDAPRLPRSNSEADVASPAVAAAGVARPQNTTHSIVPGSVAGGVSSDELVCRYNGHSGSGGQLIHDAHGYPWDEPTNAGERIPRSSGWSAVLLLLVLI